MINSKLRLIWEFRLQLTDRMQMWRLHLTNSRQKCEKSEIDGKIIEKDHRTNLIDFRIKSIVWVHWFFSYIFIFFFIRLIRSISSILLQSCHFTLNHWLQRFECNHEDWVEKVTNTFLPIFWSVYRIHFVHVFPFPINWHKHKIGLNFDQI